MSIAMVIVAGLGPDAVGRVLLSDGVGHGLGSPSLCCRPETASEP